MQIEALGRQMYPRNASLFLDAFRIATREAYGYLFLDFRSTTPESLRVRSLVLSETVDGWQRVYVLETSLKKMEQYVLIPISEVPGLQKACRQTGDCTGASEHLLIESGSKPERLRNAKPDTPSKLRRKAIQIKKRP